MAKIELPSELPEDLARTISLSLTGGVGGTWDLGVDGMGFMLSTLDQEAPFEFRSYEVQSIPTSKTRIDDAQEPGEQTLAAWWSRAQHSWHEGAGQDVFDSPFSTRFKFSSSKGLDPWTKGSISLLKDTDELRSDDNISDYHLLATQDALFYTFNGNVQRDPDPDALLEADEFVLSDHAGTAINSITSDGTALYAAFSGGSLGIKKTPLSGIMSWTDVNSQADLGVIAFVKGRLMGTKANEIFEYDLSDGTEPERFHADPSASWEWTAITESGPAIYFSGFAGDRSEIFAARLTAQDIPFASQATVGALRSVWQSPEGETIHSIKGFIGQALLVGTSRGVRIATIVTDEGDLRVSQLIVETPEPVRWFEPQLEFSWFGWSKFDSTSSGLGRIHLGDLVYASDLMYPNQGSVGEIAYYKNRLYFVILDGSTSRIIKEHSTDLVFSGVMSINEIRFGTTERKVLRYFDMLSGGAGKWSLAIAINGGPFVDFTTDQLVSGYQEEVLNLEANRFGVEVTLKRDSSDFTKGPNMMEWRLRSEPRATGRFRYLVPVMIYDYLHTVSDREVGYVGLAWGMLNHLKAIYNTDRDILFQAPESSVPDGPKEVTVKMEDLRFKSFASPNGGKGFGGIGL